MCQATGFRRNDYQDSFITDLPHQSLSLSSLEKVDSDERFQFLYRLIFCDSDYQPSVPVVVMIWMDG